MEKVRTDNYDIAFRNNVLSITERKLGVTASLNIPDEARTIIASLLTKAKNEAKKEPPKEETNDTVSDVGETSGGETSKPKTTRKKKSV